MSEIHYFPRYSQQENAVTNNTLLLLLRLHQHNRLKFQTFMGKLSAKADIQFAPSWLRFQQQKTTEKSVVDGFIAQDSVKIAVETKRTDAFDSDQLQNHLTVFGAEQHNLLVLLSPGTISDAQLKSIRDHATPRNIQVIHTSFEDIVKQAKSCLEDYEEEMQALVDDYESFCSDMGLLPRDKYTLFAPPCGLSFPENEEFKLYYCPASRSIRSVEYLGIYAKKTVRAIGRISKVVACDVSLSANKVTVRDVGTSLTTDEEKRILGASRKAQMHDWDLSNGSKFYLCNELMDTDFRKTSPGGIRGHVYFDLEEVLGAKIPNSTSDLASLLRQHTWK